MANLTYPVNYAFNDPEVLSAGIKGSIQLYKGQALEFNGGYLQPWNPADALQFGGFAESSTMIPLSGAGAFTVGTSDGWATIQRRRKGVIWIPMASATVANIGSAVYMSDDHTPTFTSTGNGASIGTCVGLEDGAIGIDITGKAV